MFLFREHNLVISCDRGVGIKILNEDERTNHITRRINSSFRAMKKTHTIALLTSKKDVSPSMRRQLNHNIHLSKTVLDLQKKLADNTKLLDK